MHDGGVHGELCLDELQEQKYVTLVQFTKLRGTENYECSNDYKGARKIRRAPGRTARSRSLIRFVFKEARKTMRASGQAARLRIDLLEPTKVEIIFIIYPY